MLFFFSCFLMKRLSSSQIIYQSHAAMEMDFLLTWVARTMVPPWKAQCPFQSWGHRILETEGPRDVT